MKIKKIFRNPWTIGTVSSIIAGLILKFIEWFWGIKIFSFLLDFIKYLLGKSHSALTYKVPIYIIGILIVSLYLIKYISISIKERNKKKQKIIFLSYKQDTFDGVLYRWNYYKSKTGNYYIGEIVRYCPDCICRITSYKCQICRKSFLEFKNRKEIEVLIRYSIEKKYSINEFDTLEKVF